MTRPSRRSNIGKVLEHIVEYEHLEAPIRRHVIGEEAEPYCMADHADSTRQDAIGLQSNHLKPASNRGFQEPAMGAADVEKPRSQRVDMAAQPVEQPLEIVAPETFEALRTQILIDGTGHPIIADCRLQG